MLYRKLLIPMILLIVLVSGQQLKSADLDLLSDGELETLLECDEGVAIPITSDVSKTLGIDEKPYKCQLCTAAFAVSSSLRKQKRMHAGVITPKATVSKELYACKVKTCVKTFSNATSLSRHRKVHTGERSHKCDMCEKAFARADDLKTHRRIHTGERPFKCGLCVKAFAQLSSLSTHLRTHTGEKAFKCDMCAAAFTSSTSRRAHHERTHK